VKERGKKEALSPSQSTVADSSSGGNPAPPLQKKEGKGNLSHPPKPGGRKSNQERTRRLKKAKSSLTVQDEIAFGLKQKGGVVGVFSSKRRRRQKKGDAASD